MPIAQLRYVADRGRWTLYWPDRNIRWHEDDAVTPAKTLAPLVGGEGRHARDLDVAIAVGEAGQTKPGHIICSQVRTISILRAQAALQSGLAVQYVTDTRIRTGVRESLAIHLGLDIPGFEDGAHLDAGFETDLAAPEK
jgi:hypothetical protein